MSFATQIAADVSDVFLNTGDFAESLTLLDPHGAQRSITAIVDRFPERTELREGHRLRIEPAEVYAAADSDGLGGVSDQWAAQIDSDPTKAAFDFIEFRENDAGLASALFERVTIIDTGLPQPASV